METKKTKIIYTGNYFECLSGNLISISKDKGVDAGFEGKFILALAPKEYFFRQWKNNRKEGKLSEEENNLYYVREFYREILLKEDILGLLEKEEKPILLCYEKGQEFCHRHIIAAFIEIKYGIEVKDIKCDEYGNIEINPRPRFVDELLIRVMNEEV